MVTTCDHVLSVCHHTKKGKRSLIPTQRVVMVEVLTLSKMSSHSLTLCGVHKHTKDVLQPALTGQPTPTHTVCVHSHSYVNAGVCFPAILPGDLFFTCCPTLSDSLHTAVPIFILYTHLSTSCLTCLSPHHLIPVSAPTQFTACTLSSGGNLRGHPFLCFSVCVCVVVLSG